MLYKFKIVEAEQQVADKELEEIYLSVEKKILRYFLPQHNFSSNPPRCTYITDNNYLIEKSKF